MEKYKLILDVRFCACAVENVDGNSLPGEVGKLYSIPSSVFAWGQRIARKLREYEYSLGGFDHLYINFTPLLEEHQFSLSSRMSEPWLRYVDYGLNPATVRNMEDPECELFVVDCVFRVLTFLSSGNEAQQKVIMRVQSELAALGSELEILHKEKETSSYRVVVTYKILPGVGNSVGCVEYYDKKTGARGKKRFVDLTFYEDIFPLVGSISVSGGCIRITPRTSFTASLDSQRYPVPFVIPINEIVSGSDT